MQKGSYTNQNFIGLFFSSYMGSGLIMNQCQKKFSTLRRYQKYLKWILMFWNVHVIEINLNVKIIWRMLMQWQRLPQINMSEHIRISLRLWQKPALWMGCRIGRSDFIFALVSLFLFGFHICIFSQKIFALAVWIFLGNETSILILTLLKVDWLTQMSRFGFETHKIQF